MATRNNGHNGSPFATMVTMNHQWRQWFAVDDNESPMATTDHWTVSGDNGLPKATMVNTAMVCQLRQWIASGDSGAVYGRSIDSS